MSFDWEPEETYFRIGPDFQIAESFEKIPRKWPEKPKKRALEQVLQTYLVCHLSEVAGVPLKVIGYSGFHWRGADITAVDELGRIHLFELKRGTVNSTHAEQLARYLLAEVFTDPNQHIQYWWNRRTFDFSPENFAFVLAGALAEVWGHTVSNKLIAQLLGRSAKEQKNIPVSDKTMALLRLATNNRSCSGPSYEQLLQLSKEMLVKMKLRGTGISVDRFITKKLVAEKRVVIWLVGPSFSNDVLNGDDSPVRLWRRAGVDARCLEVEVRSARKGFDAYLRCRKESAPSRDTLEQELLTWATSRSANKREGKLRLKFYDTCRASDPKISKGGTVLSNCEAILLEGNDELQWNGKGFGE